MMLEKEVVFRTVIIEYRKSLFVEAIYAEFNIFPRQWLQLFLYSIITVRNTTFFFSMSFCLSIIFYSIIFLLFLRM